ncbi:hypothetical protein MVES_001199 [Malassezia vespertilionis]|uniref:Uncharacterized protein n=1 Tax=Malassezia vespertilionis TaxID=2020962 RepID=A0A2N1JE61_9BASI|nr:hypothetical protein MVES_001199 [Malassezia vespertilionis]
MVAQSPQIFKNQVTKNVEGLSPVFLLQWTAGDLTNVVGAALTGQSAIQIIIAIYMLTVDLILCAQYIFFYKPATRHRDGPHGRYAAENAPVVIAKYFRADVPSLRTNSLIRTPQRHGSTPYGTISVPMDPSQSADLMERRHHRVRPHTTRARTVDPVHPYTRPTSVERGENALEQRGRRHSREASRANVSSRPSTTRRGTGMVLLSAFAFFSLRFSKQDPSVAVSMPSTDLGFAHNVFIPAHTMAFAKDSAQDTKYTDLRHPILYYLPRTTTAMSRPVPPREPMQFGQLIGRISAWICALLYTTSRLPQIWTNYQRKSVRGLSILLFVLALIGNVLYSTSILTNPKIETAERRKFLLESFPFLLGSMGTVIFDLVIILQWWMWHTKCAVQLPEP